MRSVPTGGDGGGEHQRHGDDAPQVERDERFERCAVHGVSLFLQQGAGSTQCRTRIHPEKAVGSMYRIFLVLYTMAIRRVWGLAGVDNCFEAASHPKFTINAG